MSCEVHNDELNQVLINLSRRLLQYAGETCPWTDCPDVEATIDELVESQKAEIAKLVHLLWNRNWIVDFGTYPTEYTDLHFLAFDHLLDRIIETESQSVADLEAALKSQADDTEAVAVLEEILETQKQIVERLKSCSAAEGTSQKA